MTSSELSRVVYVLVVFGLVVIQLAYEVDSAQRMVNSTNDNNDPHGRSGKVAMFPYRMLGIQRRKRTTKAEGEPFALFVASSSSIDQEKRARSSFRGDLGKRMLVLTDALSPEDDLSTRVTWLPGKRIKVSSRFRGDLGKRARSSFRGDLGKREELREQNEEQDDLQQTPLIDDNIHQLSPFLLSDSRGRDSSRFDGGVNSHNDNAERNDDYDAGDKMTFGDKTATAAAASLRWHQPVPRWR